jgi:hypothetical protein
MTNPLRTAISALSAAVAAGSLAACTVLGEGSRRVPLPQLPQVEGASEALQGERLNYHRTCTGTSRTTDELLACMRSYGYEFIPRAAGYPAAECWSLRDGGRDAELPPPVCFRKTRE